MTKAIRKELDRIEREAELYAKKSMALFNAGMDINTARALVKAGLV